MTTLKPSLKRNDKRARWIIWVVSCTMFVAFLSLNKNILHVNWPFSFDVNLLGLCSAIINSFVFLLLIAGFWAVKRKKYVLHKRIMLSAIILSILFLACYVTHHLFAGDTHFGGNGLIKYVYFFILITHILLASLILPLILFTAYRALSGNYERHKKIARFTWPIWLYIAATGVSIYVLISPYYP